MKHKIITTVILALLIIFILFKIDRVNSLNDISKINRIELYDKEGNLFYSSNNLHEGSYLTSDEIPEIVKNVFIFSEDKRFYNHSGFDIYRIGSSIFNRSQSGASTITQQLIKNLYFNNERSYARKLKELYLSIRLERIYTKDEILEAYLNTLYFNHNVYGISDASYYYFNKSINELTIAEVSILANIIKNPTLFSPVLNYTEAIIKKNALIKNLHSAKLITTSEMTKAISQEIIITKTRMKIYNDGVLFFKDKVLDELKDINIDSDFNQTIKVYTMFDSTLNNNLVKKIETSNLKSEVASIVVDKEGYYQAIIGGSDYYTSTFNIALNGTRQIASTVKPILYYYALSHGFNATSKLLCTKSNFKINDDTYSFDNYAGVYETSPIPLCYALATSDNMYALKVHSHFKLKGISYMLSKYGISSTPDIQEAIGNVSMSLNSLLNIYYSFQSLGYSTSFKTIKSVVVNKKIVYKQYFNYNKILNSDTCFILNDLMTYMFDTNISHNTSVTGKSISSLLNGICAGKSGLADYDSYMVGYNPDYLIGCWVGNPDNTLLYEAYDKAFPKLLFLEAFNSLVSKDNNSWYDETNNVVGVYEAPIPFYPNYKKTVYYLK